MYILTGLIAIKAICIKIYLTLNRTYDLIIISKIHILVYYINENSRFDSRYQTY